MSIIKKNDILNLEITSITSEGYGIGRYNGMAIFIPAAAIGDVLEIKVLKVLKSYAFGKMEKILKKSNYRISPDCEVFIKCGGCTLRHIPYNVELKIKEDKVKDAIKRIGGFDNIKIDKMVGSQNYNHYRNKAQIPIGTSNGDNLLMGFFAPNSHRIINYDKCLLQPQIFNNVIKIFKEWIIKYKISLYDESLHKGVVRYLYLRYAEKTKELMVCIIINDKKLIYQNELIDMLKNNVLELKTIVINYNTNKTNVIIGDKCEVIFGDGYIIDKLCGLRFRISPLSFYQVNRSQAEILYSIAKEYAALNKNDTLLDLYCGTGTIGLTMADSVDKVIGVECIKQAVEDAKVNAKLNNIKNAEFMCLDVSKAANVLYKQALKPNVVVIDPPRKGCDSSLITTIVNMKPDKIIYISCDPATLARDLKIFKNYSYAPNKITPVDMFPRTSHVECVVLMSRVEKQICEKALISRN